ncbi:MAG: PD-(D/E)XK nuclease family protein [Thermomicrobiales bacterium]
MILPPSSQPVLLTRDRNVSPTLLNHFARCPHRVRLQYIGHVSQPRQYDHSLSQGRIAHDLLKFGAEQRKRGMPLPEAEQLRRMANPRVPASEFQREKTRLDFVDQIVRWVMTGFSYLGDDIDILFIEKFQSRPLGRSTTTLLFKPDVILKREDRDGEFIQVIDYKTGRIFEDDDVPVLARFILKPMLRDLFGDPSAARVCFTYIWLEHKEHRDRDLTVEFCDYHWPNITHTIERLFAETEWKPNPTQLCNYCPYNGNVCTAYQPAAKAANNT